MIVCKWCGQQSQSDVECDWCKRPFTQTSSIDLTRPAKTEVELLGEEPVERVSPIKLALVAVCVCACIGLCIIALRLPLGSTEPATAMADEGEEYAAERSTGQGNYYNPTSRSNYGGVKPDRPRLASKPSAPAGGSKRSGKANSNQTVPGAPIIKSSPVVIKDLIVTVVNAGGTRKLMGTAVIHNGSDKKVVDYRAQIQWGSETYSASLLMGRPGSQKPIDERVIEPGENVRCAIVSQPIRRAPPGNPTAVTLQAWLDGLPGTATSEHPIK